MICKCMLKLFYQWSFSGPSLDLHPSLTITKSCRQISFHILPQAHLMPLDTSIHERACLYGDTACSWQEAQSSVVKNLLRKTQFGCTYIRQTGTMRYV